MTLRKKSIAGLLWTFLDTFVLKGLTFIASLVLARILGPEQFGLIGLIAIFISIGSILVDSGLSASIIRTVDADDADFNTIFYTNICISLAIYVLIFFGAPFISEFYKQDILVPVIRIFCLSFLLSALSSVQTSILVRSMNFKRLMLCNIPGIIVGVILGITLGYLGYGVWSIVFMNLCTQLVQTMVIWIFSSWKPSLIFSKTRLEYHLNFGYKLMISALIDTLFKNVYNVIIGKFYSLKSLGYYERAHTFNEYPVSLLTSIIGKVTYPLLANIQQDKPRISLVYKQLLQGSFFITAPLMLGAAAIAHPVFFLVLGTQWLPAVPFFQILCLASTLYPIHSFNINVLMVYGRTDLFLKLEIIKKTLIVICIGGSITFGIYGLVWSSVVTSFLALLVNTHYSRKIIDYKTGHQLMDMLPTFIISLSMSGLMYLSKALFVITILQILGPAIIGIIFYLAVNYLFKTKPFMFCLNLMKNFNI